MSCPQPLENYKTINKSNALFYYMSVMAHSSLAFKELQPPFDKKRIKEKKNRSGII